MIFLFKPSLPQRRMVSPAGRRDNDLPRLILIFVAAKKSGSACCGRGGNNLPRPILFFVAAKKNGQPAGRH